MIQDLDIEIVRSLMFEPGTPNPDAAAAARARLITAAGSDRRGSRQRLYRLPPLVNRRAPFGVVLVGAAVAAALVVSTAGHDSVVHPQVASAATILAKAADAVTDGVAADPGPDEYLYTKEIWVSNGSDNEANDTNGDPESIEVTQIVNTWQDAQGGFQTRDTTKVNGAAVNPNQILVGNSHATYKGTRYGTIEGTIRLSSDGLGDLTYIQLQAMPTDTTGLRAEIAKMSINAPEDNNSPAWMNHEMFTIIHDILLEQLIPAKLRAALYQVAATIPGVTVLGLTKDAAGRDALTVTFNDPLYTERDELLFDPNTYLLTGENEVNTNTGKIQESEAIVKSQLVNAIPEAVQTTPAFTRP